MRPLKRPQVRCCVGIKPEIISHAYASNFPFDAAILPNAPTCIIVCADKWPGKHGVQILRSHETGRLPAAMPPSVFFDENAMPRQNALPSQLPPRLIGREAAAAYVCLSPTIFDKLVGEGRMPKPRQLSPHRKAWDVRELDLAIDNLPKDGESADNADFGWDR